MNTPKPPPGRDITLRLGKPVFTTQPWYESPAIRRVQRRAIKAERQAIKRKLDPNARKLSVGQRKELLRRLDDLAAMEHHAFGVVHKAERHFLDYGGRFPTADVIICNAIARRCYESGRPHLVTPKLAAMFPDVFRGQLQREMKSSPKVRNAVRRIKAGQIKAGYKDPVGWLIAEHYFDSTILAKPLCRMSRDEAARQINEHFGKQITVDAFRRYVKALYLREYT